MHPHSMTLIGQLRDLIHNTTGVSHYFLVTSLYAGIVFCIRRLWIALEPLIARVWFRKWTYERRTRDFHRVTGRDHLGEMIDPTMNEQRRGKALTLRRERKLGFAVCLAVIVPIAWHWMLSGHLFGSSAFFNILGVTWGVPAAFGLLILLAWEILYLTGNQWIAGPRELFPIPSEPPGPDFSGMPWGDAKPAPLEDVLAAYGGQGHEPQTRYPE